MLLRFTKMHGLGNDFVLLDLVTQGVQLSPEQIKQLSDRRVGIGFDQLLTAEPPDDPTLDFKYRVFNADGTEAEQCGNGARCFLRFVRDRGLTNKTAIKLQTSSGVVECRLEKDGNVSVNLGPPELSPVHIPFVAEQAQILYDLSVELPLCASKQVVQVSAVSMGNPHAVLRVDSVARAPVAQLGPAIERHERFPNRVNVGFMEVVGRDRIRLRVFERGAGETRACGSGAAAAVVAGRLQGLLDERVAVELPGGTLSVEWAGDNAPVLLAGPTSRVYEGRLQI